MKVHVLLRCHIHFQDQNRGGGLGTRLGPSPGEGEVYIQNMYTLPRPKPGRRLGNEARASPTTCVPLRNKLTWVMNFRSVLPGSDLCSLQTSTRFTKMVCPMLNRRPPPERPVDYPYESLYRPWSWVLASFSNLFLFAILGAMVFVFYKRWKAGKGKNTVSYRKVEVKKRDTEIEGKVNVVVTGGNGYVGRRIVKYLLQDGGYEVHSLDLWIPDEKDRNLEVCSYIQADVTNLDDLNIALREASGVEAVFHVAGIVPHRVGFSSADYHRINTTGTENVIKACHECGAKRLIFTSIVTVVLSKDPTQVVDGADESYPYPDNPLNAFVASKGAAEKLVRAANGKNGLLTCVLRPGVLYGGSGNPLMRALANGGGAYPTRDYVFGLAPIEATARAHILAEKKLHTEGKESIAAGKAYNLCLEEKISERTLQEYAANVTGNPPPQSLPAWLFTLHGYVNDIVFALTRMAPFGPTITAMSMQFMVNNTFSSARAHKELGWEEFPPWQDVVKQLIEDCREEQEAKKLK